MKTLRLILGDQLNPKHSWFDTVDDNVVFLMAEMRQETDYVRHHIQKVVAFFLSMRSFSNHLQSLGHNVIYYQLDDTSNQQDPALNINSLIDTYRCIKFEYQEPDEYRLDLQLKSICKNLSIETQVYKTEHFLTDRADLEHFFEGKKQFIMEYFYRDMRKKYNILIDESGNPEGGEWNYDKSNRKKWNDKDRIPKELTFDTDVKEVVAMIQLANINTMGNIDVDNFGWPTSFEESQKVLKYFCENLLKHFGDYQDAMHTDQKFLFHSRLSFAMNSKMLHPLDIVKAVINYWLNHRSDVDLTQVEGFVRQIIGWREYMRGIYWMQMPEYAKLNKLDNQQNLPKFYWTGKTKMNCLQKSVKQSLDDAYAHHIQRLMVLGNFALLSQVHPDQVDQWYLGVYIDAIEWVEITNTRGMSQFADGGIVATKPYVSSGNYINKMSNYCKECHYNVNDKTGEKACPFNSLFWNFLDDKKDYFKGNNRMGMMMNLLNKMDHNTLMIHKERALKIMMNPDEY